MPALDIKEPQFIREFPDDAEGWFWHHRVALKKTGPGRWVCLTPDFEYEAVDLNNTRHKFVPRGGDFPAAQRPYVYAFDPMTQADVVGYVRGAAQWGVLLGDDEAPGALEWVVCDVRDPNFGQVVPADVVEDGVSLTEVGDKGIVDWDGVARFVEQVEASGREALVKEWRAADRDTRVLSLTRTAQGRRYLRLRDAVDAFSEGKFDDWPHAGERAATEFMEAVADGAES